jgi:hypothetical protein
MDLGDKIQKPLSLFGSCRLWDAKLLTFILTISLYIDASRSAYAKLQIEGYVATQVWCHNCPEDVAKLIRDVPTTNLFRLALRDDGSWQITSASLGESKTAFVFTRYSLVGTNMFSYRHSNQDRQRILANRQSSSSPGGVPVMIPRGQMDIRAVTLPPANEDFAISILWVGFLSGHWLRETEGDLLPHLHNIAPPSSAYRNSEWSFRLTNGCVGLSIPTSLQVNVNGTYRPGEEGVATMRLPEPFAKGFMQGAYQVVSWKEWGGACRLPERAILRRYWPVFTPLAKTFTNAVALEASYVVTNALTSRVDWESDWTVKEGESVVIDDYRLGETTALPVRYLLTNSLVIPGTRQAMVVAANFKSNMEETHSRLQRQKHRAPIIVAAFVVVFGFPALYFLLRRRKPTGL